MKIKINPICSAAVLVVLPQSCSYWLDLRLLFFELTVGTDWKLVDDLKLCLSITLCQDRREDELDVWSREIRPLGQGLLASLLSP